MAIICHQVAKAGIASYLFKSFKYFLAEAYINKYSTILVLYFC
ncbi:hypothetical protein [Polynucleobacter sp. MWH-Spelu-300-X4]|nr:hypothetical protein [Polynucleobacter sp. MWH-Spelu-300-X4]